MRATGIVRRIDDLGRVVIPKEIRRVMRIREGDPLEIYTEGGGEVIFKKYSPVGEMSSLAKECAEALSKETLLSVAICDRDCCIASCGMGTRDFEGKRITREGEVIMEERRNRIFEKPETVFENGMGAVAAAPIITAGDIAGCVFLFSNERQSVPGETDLKLAMLSAKFLAGKTE